MCPYSANNTAQITVWPFLVKAPSAIEKRYYLSVSET